MNHIEDNPDLEPIKKSFLIIAALIFSFLLLFLKNDLRPSALDDLARSSLPPQEALANGKPTILEFYADWCEVCQEMAPAMLEAKQQFSEDIDFVLLNVDNQQWIDLLKKYKVNGIPQLNLFDEDGSVYASSIGKRNQNEIFNLIQSVLQKKSIEDTYQVGKISSLEQKSSGTKENLKSIDPRSHF